MSPAELIGPAELFAHALSHIEKVMATPAGVIAIVAAATAAVLIVVSSFVKTMVPLRWLAVGSNAGFVVYGALSPSFLTLLLEGILLPINIYRALEMRRLTRRVTAAAANDDLSGIWPTGRSSSWKSAARSTTARSLARSRSFRAGAAARCRRGVWTTAPCFQSMIRRCASSSFRTRRSGFR